jgi:cold shock CspA family protein
MQIGNIVQLFQDKEYGFIRTKSGEIVHFHKNCLWGIRFDELSEGQEVKFFSQLVHKGLLGFEIQPV